MPATQHELEALARRVEPRSTLLRSWPLAGGVSAQVFALETELADGRTEKLVVRCHGATDLRRNPQLAADEFRLLQLLQSAGLPVPAPRYLDADAEILSTPCLVVDYVEGEAGPTAVDRASFVDQFAAALTRIHRIEASASDLSFLPERTLSGRPARSNSPVLLHGDFWPGNTLWNDGRLVAVIDWEDAAFGDPLADVANARLELLWALGAEAMCDLTQRYASAMPEVDMTDLPNWDLWADARLAGRVTSWNLDKETEERMLAGHEEFVAQALQQLRGA